MYFTVAFAQDLLRTKLCLAPAVIFDNVSKFKQNTTLAPLRECIFTYDDTVADPQES